MFAGCFLIHSRQKYSSMEFTPWWRTVSFWNVVVTHPLVRKYSATYWYKNKKNKSDCIVIKGRLIQNARSGRVLKGQFIHLLIMVIEQRHRVFKCLAQGHWDSWSGLTLCYPQYQESSVYKILGFFSIMPYSCYCH